MNPIKIVLLLAFTVIFCGCDTAPAPCEPVQCNIPCLEQRVADLESRIELIQAERNVYRRMVFCYGEWFQGHPSDSMPDCHGGV